MHFSFPLSRGAFSGVLACFLIAQSCLAEIHISAGAKGPISLFPDQKAKLDVVCENRNNEEIRMEVGFRLFQVSGSIVAPFGATTAWKEIHLLPGQRVLEEVVCSFPPVKSAASFLLTFYGKEEKLGLVAVRVYPRSIIDPLVKASEENRIGVLDPENRVTPFLKSCGVQITELESAADSFDGKLMILGPFDTPRKLPENFNADLRRRCESGASIVLFAGENVSGRQLPTDIYDVGSMRIVRCDSRLIADLVSSPEAQLLLLHAVTIASSREPIKLDKLRSE